MTQTQVFCTAVLVLGANSAGATSLTLVAEKAPEQFVYIRITQGSAAQGGKGYQINK